MEDVSDCIIESRNHAEVTDGRLDIRPGASRITASKCVSQKKRSYGIEYRIPTRLNVESRGKLIKLEQPTLEVVNVLNQKVLKKESIADNIPAGNSCDMFVKNKNALLDVNEKIQISTDKHGNPELIDPIPQPSKTNRIYQIVKVANLAHIPKLCFSCYHINCICDIINSVSRINK